MTQDPARSRPAGGAEVALSLKLHLPDRIFLPGSTEKERVLLHLEIRNRQNAPWEGDTPNGPLLEVVVRDATGGERSRQTRLCPMLAFPTRLEVGRGFNLPLFVLFPEVAARGEDFTIEVRFIPGHEKVTGHLRIEPRG